MAEFAYLDESLDINQTVLYHLSIQISLNGLSFCILNTVNQKYIALKHYPLPAVDKNTSFPDLLRKTIEKDEFLRKEYKSRAVMIISFKSTLVPAPLYDEKFGETYFRFNHALEDNEKVMANRIKGLDAWNLFVIPDELSALLEEYFPDAILFHQITPFLNNIIRHQTPRNTKPVIFVNIHDDFFDLAVFREQSPEMVNSFYYRQVNDLVYFILYALKAMKADPSTTPLLLMGKINPESNLLQSLHLYIKNITLVKRNPAFTYSYTLNMITEHSFANLFNLYLCV